MEAACLFITLLIFAVYYAIVSVLRPSGIVYRLLAASVLTCAQIILTELALGLAGRLYLSYAMIANLALPGLVLMRFGRSGRIAGVNSFRNDAAILKLAAGEAYDGYLLALGALATFAYGWILVAAYYLPPRGIDDLSYHLPAVFEYVRSHEIRLLPLSTQPFAYPENAELLFLWPVLFSHDQRMVDGVNVPFVLLSVLAVYALARHFSLPKRDSLFASLLYAFCPVVLMQAGVNYVDIIVSLFLLLSMYFTFCYYERQQWLDLVLAGLATGLMCGMKYTAPFLALPLLVLMWPSVRNGKGRHAAAYGSIVVLAGGWWYLRNAFVLGEPLYPVHFQTSVPDGLVNLRGGSVFQNIRYNLPYWVARYPLQDSKVGTYDGGFGLVFWGMCFSSWVYVTCRSVFTFRSASVPKLIALAYVPCGFMLLLAMPPRFVEYNGRMAMFVVAIGLVAFSEVLTLITESMYKGIIKTISLALSAITVSLLFISLQPLYRFGEALDDAKKGERSSEFRYLAASFEPHIGFSRIWELFDLLTRDSPTGLSCSILSDPGLYWPSPVYGSRLQNRVLNMGTRTQQPVDAYVCAFLDKNQWEHPLVASTGLSIAGSSGHATIPEVLSNRDYVCVVHSGNSCLMVREDIFNLPDKQRILLEYYRRSWPDEIELAARLDSRLDPSIPVVASGGIGYGVLYLDMKMGRPRRVELVFDGMEEKIALQKGIVKSYTFQKPLSGFRSEKIVQLVHQGKELNVFLNRRL